MEAEEVSWCLSSSNSRWQGWSCGQEHCPSGNATYPIWRVLASSLGISSWTHLKVQYSNPNPNPLANQLWCIDFFTPPTPLIIPHRLPTFLESLMPLKNRYSIHARWSKSSLKHSMRFRGIYSLAITPRGPPPPCTMCWFTNYHNTNNHSGYLQRFHLLRSRDNGGTNS